MVDILILYYSRHGATEALAREIAQGVDSVAGANSRLRTIPTVSTTCESTSPSVPNDGPPFAELKDLQECAGLAVGSPTRFGNMAAAMKYFIDGTINTWLAGELIDKPFSVFTSTSSLHGGQESTLLSMALPFLHHGMVYVGLPYSEAALSATETGGTPYGVSHWAGGQNNKPLSQHERTLAQAQGVRLARMAVALNGMKGA